MFSELRKIDSAESPASMPDRLSMPQPMARNTSAMHQVSRPFSIRALACGPATSSRSVLSTSTYNAPGAAPRSARSRSSNPTRFAEVEGFETVAEFVEVETGKGADASQRPNLAKRSRARMTVFADHGRPLGVGTLRSFRTAATLWADNP
jgi:hypothetical protein